MRDRILNFAIVGAPLILLWIYIAFWSIPKLPVSTADGAYFNSCCEPIILNRGFASSGHVRFNYVVERDKIGPYILTSPDHTLISVSKSGLTVTDGWALKMRFDDKPDPSWIDIIGDPENPDLKPSYRFARRPAR